MEILYAHTKNEHGAQHFLQDHLSAVADSTGEFSSYFYQGNFKILAWLLGISHDLGKVHPAFQEYLRKLEEGHKPSKTPHSPWGALFIMVAMGRIAGSVLHEDLAVAIAGHHAGLSEIGSLSTRLNQLEPQKNDMYTRMNKMFQSLISMKQAMKMLTPSLNSHQRELLTRMLFSALVDADRLDTERHTSPGKHELRTRQVTMREMAEKLKKAQTEIIEQNAASLTLVNRVRRVVYEDCLIKAVSKPGIFRLTVPTGGGKTRSALAFALDHALVNGQERIVFALPYTSIIDQTAKVYREILGDDAVLEHHSQLAIQDDGEGEDARTLRFRLAEENWDLPLIVTTNVQLLESLFSNTPSRCRKIHRLANSVLIFDEAQTLPADLLKPTLQVLRDLVDNYKVTVILATATQPSLNADYLTELNGLNIQEIVPEYEQHFWALRRVQYERRFDPLTVKELAAEIVQHDKVLVIFNTRKRALELVDILKDEGCLHLSTLLCGEHRKKVLEDVRNRLKEKKPVCLISTQVVEAGVDLDFPIVYRALGPLDRIVQAAGRCNREGKLPELGRVVIFELAEEKPPQGPYKAGLEEARRILFEHTSPDVLNEPEIFKTYFSRLYNVLANDLDRFKIQDMRAKLNYPDTAAAYHLIREETLPVVVRYGEYQKALEQWLNYPGKNAWRQLQPYVVSIYKREAGNYLRDGLLSDLGEGLYRWEGKYDELKGIGEMQWDPSDLMT